MAGLPESRPLLCYITDRSGVSGGDVLAVIEKHSFAFRTFPVVNGDGRLMGLLPGHVVKPRHAKLKIAEALLPRAQVHTINKKALKADPITQADKFFTDHPGIHKLLVVDDGIADPDLAA